MLLDGERYATFILEEGGIAFNKDREAVGSMLNDRFNQMGDSASAIGARFQAATSEDAQRAIYNEYTAFMDSQLEENADNPIGYYLFLQKAGNLNREEFSAELEKYPAFAKYERVTSSTRASSGSSISPRNSATPPATSTESMFAPVSKLAMYAMAPSASSDIGTVTW